MTLNVLQLTTKLNSKCHMTTVLPQSSKNEWFQYYKGYYTLLNKFKAMTLNVLYFSFEIISLCIILNFKI